jgi:hypothetical protein
MQHHHRVHPPEAHLHTNPNGNSNTILKGMDRIYRINKVSCRWYMEKGKGKIESGTRQDAEGFENDIGSGFKTIMFAVPLWPDTGMSLVKRDPSASGLRPSVRDDRFISIPKPTHRRIADSQSTILYY